MSDNFYLPRKLLVDGNPFTEEELIGISNYIIILAEPGGGKTRLLESFALRMNASLMTANRFKFIDSPPKNSPLIIDAFDELSKIEQSAVHGLLGKAEGLNPTKLIISSRSSEWNVAATHAFEEFFGEPPIVATLCEFSVQEQGQIFENDLPGESFKSFKSEVSRFNLEVLLPNPQFLILFAHAYIQSNRRFTDKKSIFVHAIKGLIKESNPKVKPVPCSLSLDDKIIMASKVNTNILLSGAEGVAIGEVEANDAYPSLSTLTVDANASSLFSTKLFKPGVNANYHRPVHKIVVEYTAANYLTARINDNSDNLTLEQCLPIIAPNRVVRDELRGLLGWMASLGRKETQEVLIELDPYAVLANGDPSELLNTSKHLLINHLSKLQDVDPYFRGGESARSFSVMGFFTQNFIEVIKPILSPSKAGSLRGLMIDLIFSSNKCELFETELRALALAPEVDEDARIQSLRCLLSIKTYNHINDFDVLRAEASVESLRIMAKGFSFLGLDNCDFNHVLQFLKACADLYSSSDGPMKWGRRGRYFIKELMRLMPEKMIVASLDELAYELNEESGERALEYDHRIGHSKIVGALLDQYFELVFSPYDANRIWSWVRNLNYKNPKTAGQSKSVRVLRENAELRQEMLRYIFENLTDRNEILEARARFSGIHSHSGLKLFYEDSEFLVNLAFENSNIVLWSFFLPSLCHRFGNGELSEQAIALRRNMRRQASQKPPFMREWAKLKRLDVQDSKRYRAEGYRFRRRVNRDKRERDSKRLENIQYFKDNRRLIESGQHWNALVAFSDVVLNHPEKITCRFGDESMVRTALRNCLKAMGDQIPDIQSIASENCVSRRLYGEDILYAACLEVMRTDGNLEAVDSRLLWALKVNRGDRYRAVPPEEIAALNSETDRLIPLDEKNAEKLICQYLEPQISKPCQGPVDVKLLARDSAFSHLKPVLPIEWLRRFKWMRIDSLEELFEIAARYNSQNELNALIQYRCVEFICCCPTPTGNEDLEKVREFWFIRAWYFLSDPPSQCYDWLKSDKNNIFLLDYFSGRLSGYERSYWPRLTAKKVELILSAFIEHWPATNLPDSYGSGSPPNEKAYRFLTVIVRSLENDESIQTISVLKRLLSDMRLESMHKDLKGILAYQNRRLAHQEFKPPSPSQINELLERGAVVTVEGLRQQVLQNLKKLQREINGGSYNTIRRFYTDFNQRVRLGEVESTEVIAEWLNPRLEILDIVVKPEEHVKNNNRVDFTATKIIDGKQRLLVVEVKGQWHDELYTAAESQLYEKYAIHPNAEEQGIYLVLWFGSQEKVADRKGHEIESAEMLKSDIESRIPSELAGRIDVFVLDLS